VYFKERCRSLQRVARIDSRLILKPEEQAVIKVDLRAFVRCCVAASRGLRRS
jgi:hypothetical protein